MKEKTPFSFTLLPSYRLPILRFIIILTITLSSCIPNEKVVYLQDEANAIPLDSIIDYNYPKYRLQVGDIIDIQVKSKDPTLTEIFSAVQQNNNQGQMIQGAQSGSDIFYLTGYTVNENGDVEIPVAGYLKVEGKTLEEIQPLVKELISKYIIDPYVVVRLGGIRFTAIGEFNAPGRYGILQSEVTIFEAIANARDLTVIADRRNALLIRQYPDGQKIHKIDLTDRNLIKSDFYHIQPNDQLYLPPLKVREWGTGVTGLQTLTAILGVTTTVLLLWNLIATSN